MRYPRLPRLILGLVLLPALLCLSSCSRPEAPGEAQRWSMMLDGDWRFTADPGNIGFQAAWYAEGVDRNSWSTLAVPGSWDVLRELGNYDGFGWYARRFDVPAKPGGRLALVFEAVDDNAEIWLNGTRVGEHAGYGERFFVEVTNALRVGANELVLRIEDLAGPGGLVGAVSVMEFGNEEELMRGKFAAMAPVRSADWVLDAVIYEIYPRSFSKEGSLRAIEQRLPELKALGVTVLWLMPIHPVGEVNRKGTLGSPYAVRDYYAVNPEFGSMEDMRSLVAATHRHGMRIIIDLVANHTAWDNPLITEHPEWYTKNSAGQIIPPNADWHDVADLDYAQPGLRKWMKDMLLFWVRDVGIDGFRCDVAEMVPHDFWVEAIRALRAVKPVMMLAEGAEPELHIDAFDITYAWNTYDILRPLFRGEVNSADVLSTLQREQWRYPRRAPRLRFSSNHDKDMYDAPAAAWFGAEQARAAAVLVSLLPGIPLLYNGQEVGNTTPLQLFEKVPIDWSRDEHGFRQLYTTLFELRRRHPALRRGELRMLRAHEADALVAYARELHGDGVLVLVNTGSTPLSARVVKPLAVSGTPLLVRGEVRLEAASIHVDLPAFGYAVLR